MAGTAVRGGLHSDVFDCLSQDYRLPRLIVGAAAAIGSRDYFQATVETSLRTRTTRSEGHSVSKLYVGGAQVTDLQSPMWPANRDLHLANLLARIDSGDFDSYLYYSNCAHSFSPVLAALAFGIRDYLEEGVCRGHRCKVDAEIFLGRYPRTPGGVHREACHNLHSVLMGRKSIFVWPPDSVTRPSRDDGEGEVYLPVEPLNAPTELRGEAGDLIYWPPGYWHVGESRVSSAALNFAVYVHAAR